MQEKVSLPEDLILKYIKGELKEEEHLRLNDWLAQAQQNKILFDYITNDKNLEEELKKFRSCNPETVKARLSAEWPAPKVVRMRRLPGWTYMAAASVLIAVASYLVLIKKPATTTTTNNAQQVAVNNDVVPGKYKAKLKLADGLIVYLDSANNEIIGQQGSIAVKNSNGQLIYEQKGKQSEVLYNTLTTAKGETYTTVLADGSKVWLNSESSVRYPVALDGAARKVEITGEAYFEVAPSVAILANGQKGKRPFIVDASGLEVEVLGTHFDINNYEDEEVAKTTLLEGKVKVKGNSDMIVLSPGQQAQLTKLSGEIKVDKNADLDKAVAWKNGIFLFDGDNIKSVMNQLARWYDLKVIYEGNVNEVFYGTIDRNETVSKVLEILQKGSTHFKIQNNTITVTP